MLQWEKRAERPQRRPREGPAKPHRESEFKPSGSTSQPYIQTTDEAPPRHKSKSGEGIGRGKRKSSGEQANHLAPGADDDVNGTDVQIGLPDSARNNSVGKESYRRPDFSADSRTGDPKRDFSQSKREERRVVEERRGVEEPVDRHERSRSRGGRHREYRPQAIDRQEYLNSYKTSEITNVLRDPVAERAIDERPPPPDGARDKQESVSQRGRRSPPPDGARDIQESVPQRGRRSPPPDGARDIQESVPQRGRRSPPPDRARDDNDSISQKGRSERGYSSRRGTSRNNTEIPRFLIFVDFIYSLGEIKL